MEGGWQTNYEINYAYKETMKDDIKIAGGGCSKRIIDFVKHTL